MSKKIIRTFIPKTLRPEVQGSNVSMFSNTSWISLNNQMQNLTISSIKDLYTRRKIIVNLLNYNGTFPDQKLDKLICILRSVVL